MRAIQKHFIESRAKGYADKNANPKFANEYEKMLLLLARVRKDLKGINSMRTRAAIKKKYLPDFLPWINGALQGKGKQDHVVTQWLVWSLDINDFDLAYKIATYCIHYNLTLPVQFERTLPTFYVEELAKIAKRARDLEKPFKLQVLKNALKLTEYSDISEIVLAKLWREVGLRQKARGSLCALKSLRKALNLDPSCGVKGAIKTLEKRTKKTK